MSMNQQLLDYVRDYKQRNPIFKNEDDEYLAGYLSRRNKLPEGIEYKPIEQPQIQITKENSNLSFMGELLDYGIDETSSDFWKESYNRSLSSEVGKALFGKEKYDTSKYAENMNVLEDIGTTVVSFMFPADVLAMKVGGKAGVMAYQGLLSKAAPQLAKSGGILSERILLGASGQAGGLAAYEGAFGGISAYNEGKSQADILDATAEGVVHGGILGALTGAVGQGMAQKQAELLKTGLFRKSKKAKDGVGKSLSKGEERFINLTLGVPGQIAAESSIFTGSEIIDRVQQGEDLDAKDALVSFAKNVGLFGVLKAKSRLWSDTKKVLTEPIDKYERSLLERELRSKENVEKDLSEQNVDGKLNNAIKEVKQEREKDRTFIEEQDANLNKILEDNVRVESMLSQAKIENNPNIVKFLIENVNSNIGQLENLSKKIQSKIDSLPEGQRKTEQINRKAEIDGYVAEFKELSKEYNGNFSETAERSRPRLTEKEIIKRANELGIDVSDLNIRDINQRQQASERIYDRLQIDADLRAREQAPSFDMREMQGRQNPFKIDSSPIIKAIKESKSKTKKTSTDNAILEIDSAISEARANKSETSRVHKNILSKAVLENKDMALTGSVKEVSKFLNWVEKTYNTNITNLDSGILSKLTRRYITSQNKNIDIYQSLKELNKLKISGEGNQTEKLNRLRVNADRIYDSISKIFNGLNLKSYLEGKTSLTMDIPGLKKFNVKGSRSVVIGKKGKSPREAIKDAWNWAKGQKNVGKLDGKGASLSIEVANEFRMRPGEINLLNLSEVNPNTGIIRFTESKKAGKVRTIENKDLAKRIVKYAKQKGKSPSEPIFDITTKEFGNIIKEAAEKSGSEINIYNKVTGELVSFAEGGKGLNVASLIRRIYGESTLESAATARGQGSTIATTSYADIPTKTTKPTPSKKPLKINEVDTAEKSVQYYKQEQSNIKERLKTAKTASQREPLQGRLKEAGIRLSVSKRLVDVNEWIRTFEEAGIKPNQVKRLKTERAELMKQLNLKDVKKTPTKRQVERDVKLDTASIKELEAQKKYFSEIPAYKNIQINLQKNLGKFRGEQVLGRIRGHVIDIARGKAKIDTLPHEISHHAIDILTAMGTKKSKALIRDGKKMFGSEEKLVQAVGEYTAGRMKNRSMLSRAKQFVSRMMSEVRNFFGVQKEGDVVRILSEKVLKGKLDTRNPQEILKADSVKFQTGKDGARAKKEFNDKVQEFERILLEEGMTRNEINKMRKDYISSSFNSREKGYRTYKLSEVDIAELERYRDYLSTRVEGTSGVGRTIREVNTEYQITESQQKQILEAMGVREGKLENVKAHQMVKQYLAFVRKYGTKTNPEDTSYLNIGKLGEGIKLPHALKRGIMPVYYVLDTYGGKAGKKLAQKIIDFDFIHNYKIKGQGDHHAHNIHTHLKKAKQQENFYLLDKEMREKVMSERELTPKEKDFVKQLDIRDSDVYIAAKHYSNMTDFMWNSLMKAAKKHHNPVEFEQFKSRMGKKYVEDYMTRRVTPEALEIIKDANFIESFSKKLVEKAIAKEATRGKYTRKEIELNKDNQLEKIKENVYADILNIFEHKHHKIKNGYLMERVPVLPEFVEGIGADGKAKRVRTYETNSEAIVDPYVSGMSKFIATVEVFPEYTNIGGKYTLGKSKKATLEIEATDAEFAQYAKKGIRRIIGLEQPDLFASKLGRVGQGVASTSALVGLSSPLSGIKNLMLGQIRNVASFGLGNTAKAFRLGFNEKAMAKARIKGALEYGSKTLELSDQKAFGLFRMDKAFKLNLMTQTENINRISAMEAGRMKFLEQLNYLQGKQGILGTKMKEGQVRDLMKDMFRLNNQQIEFLKKGNFNTPENRRKFEGIMQVVEHYSHVSAQGGTGVGNLPLWMSNQMTKPFLLFQRFATAVTFDTYRNYIVPAVKHNNYAPMLSVVLGSYLGGAGLYMMYEELFNTQPPKEGSSNLDKAMMYLHRAELLGVFNEIISPYDIGKSEIPTLFMEPVIYRNAMEASKNFFAALPKGWGGKGTKSVEQALKDFTRKTIVIAGQAEKFYDNIVHEDFSNQKKINTMAREFKKERKISAAEITGGTTRSPYYRTLKQKIYFGKNEDIVKSYWAAHNYLVREIQYNNPTLSKSAVIKKAHSAINSSIQSMNPINFSKSVKGRDFGISQRKLFLNWIKENHGVRDYTMALELEKKFKKTYNKIKSIKNSISARNKYSVGFYF